MVKLIFHQLGLFVVWMILYCCWVLLFVSNSIWYESHNFLRVLCSCQRTSYDYTVMTSIIIYWQGIIVLWVARLNIES